MLYVDRINFFEEIDVNKKSASKGCHIYHYWYFLNYSFEFQPNVFNRRLQMVSMNLSDITIPNIKGSDYCCIIISFNSKNETINLMQNASLTKKAEHYKT